MKIIKKIKRAKENRRKLKKLKDFEGKYKPKIAEEFKKHIKSFKSMRLNFKKRRRNYRCFKLDQKNKKK
jgi:hypothetical protein